MKTPEEESNRVYYIWVTLDDLDEIYHGYGEQGNLPNTYGSNRYNNLEDVAWEIMRLDLRLIS